MKIKWRDYIEERKDVMTGKPVFKGTRLTVEFVLRQTRIRHDAPGNARSVSDIEAGTSPCRPALLCRRCDDGPNDLPVMHGHENPRG